MFSLRGRVAFLLAFGAVVVGWVLFERYIQEPRRARAAVAATAAHNKDGAVEKQVEVAGAYELEWAARSDAPALRLVLPAADLGAWHDRQRAIVSETADGPSKISLDLRMPNAGERSVATFGDWCPGPAHSAECPSARGVLVMHRDVRGLHDIQRVLAEDADLQRLDLDSLRSHWAASFWVREDRGSGAWSFAGWDCDRAVPVKSSKPAADPVDAEPGFFSRKECYVPGGWLAKHLPGWHGVTRVRLYASCIVREQGCSMAFVYRGRPVTVAFPHARWLMFHVALEELSRWARDTVTPASAEVHAERMDKAVRNCEAASARRQSSPGAILRRNDPESIHHDEMERAARDQCGYAVQVAHALLAAAPQPAADMLARAVRAHGHRITDKDRDYLGDVVTALERAGRQESREAVAAHAQRLMAARDDPEVARKSFDTLVALAPRLVAPDDVLIAEVHSALRAHADTQDGAWPRVAAFRAEWRAKAERHADDASDAGVRVRYLDCHARLVEGAERPSLDACADRLLADWEKRATDRAGTQIAGIPLSDYAKRIAWMYDSYAYATQRFEETLPKVRRLQSFARANIDPLELRKAITALEETQKRVAANAAKTAVARP